MLNRSAIQRKAIETGRIATKKRKEHKRKIQDNLLSLRSLAAIVFLWPDLTGGVNFAHPSAAAPIFNF
jgi:hypothetical protein